MRKIDLCGETIAHAGHVCAFFDSREQKYDVIIPFLQDAIRAGDEVINIVDAADRDMHLASLAGGGVPVESAAQAGKLSVLTSEETYLQEGRDVLPNLLDFLGHTLQRAREQHHCLRTLGEMSWVERSPLPITEVLKYEARVNDIVAGHDCTMVCIYDLARTPTMLMSDILATHPSAILQGKLRKNPHYVPPSEFLEMLKRRVD